MGEVTAIAGIGCAALIFNLIFWAAIIAGVAFAVKWVLGA